MKKMIVALAAFAAIASSSSEALAGGCSGPWCGHGNPAAFQAAPWYLYWPYNQHFQMPAPMYGAAWYGPQSYGAPLQSPYFPAQNYGR